MGFSLTAQAASCAWTQFSPGQNFLLAVMWRPGLRTTGRLQMTWSSSRLLPGQWPSLQSALLLTQVHSIVSAAQRPGPLLSSACHWLVRPVPLATTEFRLMVPGAAAGPPASPLDRGLSWPLFPSALMVSLPWSPCRLQAPSFSLPERLDQCPQQHRLGRPPSLVRITEPPPGRSPFFPHPRASGCPPPAGLGALSLPHCEA